MTNYTFPVVTTSLVSECRKSAWDLPVDQAFMKVLTPNKYQKLVTEKLVNDVFQQQTTAQKTAHNTLSQSEQEQNYDKAFAQISKDILTLSPTVNHVIVRVKDVGGFGDLLNALKLAQTLANGLPNVKVALAYNDQKTMNKTLSVAKEFPIAKNSYLLDKLPEEFKKSQNGICIGAASFVSLSDPSKENCQNLLGFKAMGLPDTYQYLTFPEYNATDYTKSYYDHVKPTGFQNHHYGVFIDKTLTQIATADQAQGKNSLYHLNDLTSDSLKKTIKPDAQTIEDYSCQNNLYFGYAHTVTCHKHFIRNITHFENAQKNKKNINMVLLIDKPSELIDLFKEEAFKKELVQQGIGTVEIVTHTENTKTPSDSSVILSLSNTAPKTLKIIAQDRMVHKDIETCLLMSQPLSLITGDQSLSEAISANKIFLYEMFNHKISLENSLEQLAKDLHLPLVEKYLKLSTIFHNEILNPPWKDLQGYSYKKPEDYKTLASCLINPEFQKQWQTFIKYIQERRSFNDKAVNLVSRLLASKLQPALSIESWGKDIFSFSSQASDKK